MQWVAKKALDCACVRSARACGLVCTGTASLVSRRTQGMRAGTYRTVLTHGSSCGSLISGLRNHDAWAQALKPKDGWEGNIGGGGNRRAYVEAGCCADNAHVCAAVELLRESPSARQYAHHLLHGRRLVQSAEHTSLLSPTSTSKRHAWIESFHELFFVFPFQNFEKGHPLVGGSLVGRGGMALDEAEADYLLGTDTVAPRPVYSKKELATAFEELLVTLSNKDHDFWQHRVDALRSIRALLLGGAAEYDSFMQCLHSLKTPFADALADLRSTLVREACVTVALLSQHLGNAFAHMAETLIPAILKQLPVTIQVRTLKP